LTKQSAHNTSPIGYFLQNITPVVLTFNEAPNIGRVLDKLKWAAEVVVVDSGSTDETLTILQRYSNVRCIHRPFDSHAKQWNFAISHTNITSEWVLALDADYILNESMIREVSNLTPGSKCAGYKMCFKYCIWGTPLRATLYPPVTTLFRRLGAHYVQDGHTQRINLNGDVLLLGGTIHHDDRKPLARWLSAQDRYANLEAEFLMSKPVNQLRLQDRLRRMIFVTPWLVPLYCLTVGRGLLDGRAGLYYALQRGVAEAVLSLRLLEAQLAARQLPSEHISTEKND
jgi:glycosyltransferase involved in cell wall biosynthesis